MATLKRRRTRANSERRTPRLLFRDWLADRCRVILETATYMSSVTLDRLAVLDARFPATVGSEQRHVEEDADG